MKILIISYFFAPMNKIGAVRPTKLAKYLTRMGHEVTAIRGRWLEELTDPLLERDMRELHAVHEINERNWIRIIQARRGKPPAEPMAGGAPSTGGIARKSRKARLMDSLYRYLRYRADCSFYHKALRFLKERGETYDVVFASYGPVSVQRLAWQCKRLGIAKRWIADFRDEARFPFAWQKGAQRRYIGMVRKHADCVTAAAPSYLDMTGLADHGVVLYNGYDREDLDGCAPAKREGAARLELLYCGTLFPGTTDITPLLRCLRGLMDEGLMERERVCVRYLGVSEGLFREQARLADAEGFCRVRGLVNRRAALENELAADALLLAARNDHARYGVIKGKYLEYLMIGKPILCCVSGDIPNSAIARHIREGRVGYCWEAAAGEPSTAALREYLLALYRRVLAGEPTLPDADPAYAERFDYRSLAQQLNACL